MPESAKDGQGTHRLDWWECVDCGESGHETVHSCPSCGGRQIGGPPDDVDLPPCWKEDAALAALVGVERLWVHLEGAGFIGMEYGEVELVREEIAAGMEPEPEGRPATAENVRDLAQSYNDEFYGDDNERIVTDGGRSELAILHAFADYGAEAEALTLYGNVTRATLNPVDQPHSDVIRADLSEPDRVPFRDGQFDLAVLHPPCTAYSDMPDANKDGDAPELVPEAREIGERVADHYVIENKPAAPLESPTVLDGRMFSLPIKYERAFEASFEIPQPPRQRTLSATAETSPFFYSERSPEWWRAAKGGLPARYPKEHVAKNSLPLPYVHHIVRAWMDATGASAGVADYSNYDAEMDERRAREANAELTGFN